MHAMHLAAMVGLLGVIGALGRPIYVLASGRELSVIALASQLLMGFLCAGFLALCVKSFIDARRSRQQTSA